jgi:EAL domain-containing protein (putative c-di-GMP-specific phosphodiesterase class I)
MATVAEWVKDEETIALLRGLGVGMLQGNAVGMPRFELAADGPAPSAAVAI